MAKPSTQKRAAVLRCLIEGNSILATSRITGAAKSTIIDLLERAGEACSVYQSEYLKNLPCKVIQLDEVWPFVGCPDANKDDAKGEHPGDVLTWTSICAETKLIPAWRVGDRSARMAMDFCFDLAGRFTGTLQISSHGNPAYKMAVGSAFEEVHFAQLVTIKRTPAVAAGVTDHQWTLEDVVEMIDAHFVAKVEAKFEEAFAAVNLTVPHEFPKSYTPQSPKGAWYLDHDSGGEPK